MQHAIRIPLTFIISAITLVLGQAVFEQLFKLQGVLSVVIEFLGGIVFIYLMLKKQKWSKLKIFPITSGKVRF